MDTGAGEAFTEVILERNRQDKKWGVQNHDAGTWALILLEELGEWAKAELERRFGDGPAEDCRTEMVQTTAVAMAIVECMIRNGGKLPRESSRPFSEG